MAPGVIIGESAGENTQRRLQVVNPHSEVGTRPARFGHEDENNAHRQLARDASVHIQVRGEKRTIFMAERPQLVSLFAGALNRPELRFNELLVPWIMIVVALGFLIAWLVVTIMELTFLSRFVWHLPLFFLALIVLFSSLIGMVVFP